MSITIFQVQNVLRTYQALIKTKTSTAPNFPEGKFRLQEISAPDRVTLSEASRLKHSQLPPPTKDVERQDPQEGAVEEASFAQS